MYKQKFREREKAFAQQQKELKNLKAHGKSKAHAVSFHRERGGEGERENNLCKFTCVGSCCEGLAVKEEEGRWRRRKGNKINDNMVTVVIVM